MAVLLSLLLALSSLFFTGPAFAATYLEGDVHILPHLDSISGICSVFPFFICSHLMGP